MCRTGPTIKLCTCDPEKIDPEASWQLKRNEEWFRVAVGDFLPPEKYPIDQQLVLAKILADLNGADCFDFHYKPEDGDHLDIQLGRVTYRFKCHLQSDGQSLWTHHEYGQGSPNTITKHEGVVEVSQNGRRNRLAEW